MPKSRLQNSMICAAVIAFITACGKAPSRSAQPAFTSTISYTKDENASASKTPAGTKTSNDQQNNSGSSSSDNSSDKKEAATNPTPATPTAPDTTKPGTEPVVDSLCYKADAFICEIERIIVEETNKHRTTALIHNKESSWVSRRWSDAQAAKGQISHDGFPASRKADLIAEFPTAKWNFYAENVAMNQSSGSDASKIAKEFVEMWWNSAGHKANMIGNYKSIGVGVSKKGNSYYATQIFY